MVLLTRACCAVLGHLSGFFSPLPPVGAGLLAKNVNDNAGNLVNRSAIECFVSKLAPTGVTCIKDERCGLKQNAPHH
ncbi:hypothetical protein DYL59_18410 [Pseudomonas kairouanensis]|uniref:Uncharacterized protein n=1 Tax=Pseudomonas kairouanensis TaxID=2293832 RepID=A0A4Z0ALC3_9PSED|nr:hypothetical protein DYL59_18410 [Pseudomonas kairouanensis]